MLTPRPALAPDGRLDLPWPPSDNRYYATVIVKGRATKVVSTAGKQYRRAVCDLVSLAQFRPVVGRVALEVDAYPPDRRTRDLLNLAKCLCDSLTLAGAWDDDGCVDDVRFRRREPCPGGKVLVRITAIPKECEQ